MADIGQKSGVEPVLKLVPEDAPNDAAAATPAPARSRVSLKRLRSILLFVLPALAIVGGFAFWLSGGRYISTDNAYVGAQKVLITPDISGKVLHIDVKEGQHVKAGDALFEIDPVPYRLALTQAQAKLSSVRTDFTKLKVDYKSLVSLGALANQSVELKKRDVERKTTLVNSRTGSQADLDTSVAGLVTAQLQAKYAEQQRDDTLNQLLGDADLPIEKFPAFLQAQAAVEQAQRDLDHTTLRAPMAGTATQVDAIQLGRFVPAGSPVFSVIDDSAPWVDANPKETDITYLKVGQPVTIDVDTFPDHPFKGTVSSVSPGTGAQFAILPPQNASGNWVKVVQRVPLRVAFDAGQDTRLLRSGMSVNIDIDTGRSRSLAAMLGLTAAAKDDQQRNDRP